MPLVPAVRADGSAWDLFYLGNQIIPCKRIRVTGAVGRKIDTKPVKGKDGAKQEDNGIEPPAINVELRCGPDEASGVSTALDQFDPSREGYKMAPLAIYYPSLAERGIFEVVIKKLHLAQPQANGDLLYRLECVKWYDQPKPKQPTSGQRYRRKDDDPRAADQMQQARDEVAQYEAYNLDYWPAAEENVDNACVWESLA